MADFERDYSREKNKEEGKNSAEKKGESSGFSEAEYNLQRLLGSLQADPTVIKYLSLEKISEISKKIGNQRLEAIVGGGGPLLRKGFLKLTEKETDINDISTETPRLIELG